MTRPYVSQNVAPKFVFILISSVPPMNVYVNQMTLDAPKINKIFEGKFGAPTERKMSVHNMTVLGIVFKRSAVAVAALPLRVWCVGANKAV